MLTLPIWWLILCVSLMGLRETHMIVKPHFRVCPCGCFWKRAAFEWLDWPKKILLHQWAGLLWTTEVLDRTRRQQRKGEPSLLLRGHSVSSCPWISAFLVLGPLDLDSITSLASRGLQLPDSRWWASIIMWARSYNQSPHIYPYTSYWFCFPGELNTLNIHIVLVSSVFP